MKELLRKSEITAREWGMKEQSVILKRYVAIMTGLFILVGLYLTSLYSYLLFHSLAEVFSIVVACGIFLVAWNSRRFLDNNYLLFAGIAYLFVAGIDLLHTLSYTGMGVFQGYGTDLPTQLWIAARYLESISLLIAPLFLGRPFGVKTVFFIYIGAVTLLLGSIFYWDIFPVCFADGIGLTTFKKISEYLVCLILVGAIALLNKKRGEFDQRVFRLLIASIFLTICSELAFTFYVGAYDFSNMIGHYLKIISFYLIYKAIIETGLVRPYDLLFRNLKQNEEILRESEEKYRTMMEAMADPVYICSPDYRVAYMNPAMMRRIGRDAIGELCYKAINELEERCPFCVHERVEQGEHVEVEILSPRDGRFYRVTHSPVTHRDGSISKMTIYRDMTQHKRAEEALEEARLELEQRVMARTFELTESNAQLKEEIAERLRTEQALRLDELRLEALMKLNLLTDLSFQEVAEYVLEEGVRLTESEIGFLGFMNETETELMIHSWSKHVMEECSIIQKSTHFAIEKSGLWGETIRKREAFISNDYSLPHPGKKGYPKGHVELIRFMVVPIFDGDRIVAIGAMANKEEEYDESDVRQLRLFLDGMWQIVCRRRDKEALQSSEAELRRLSSQLLSAQEEERKRISRELHDGIGQSLSAIKFTVETAINEMAQEHPAQVTQSLETIVPLIQEAVEEVRTISRDLRPSVLDDLGILATISWFCREVEETFSGIRINKRINIKEDDVPENLKTVIFRLVQEAVNNVTKHAGADAIDLYLEGTDEKIELTIEDNGVGFDLEKVPAAGGVKEGIGLTSMKERTELSGGSFLIESQKGEGTRMKASWFTMES
ncbi:MAG: GAF domain-containing protein [Deltaproteobacteria bacterium]|nr:GAF domain-containing protein [Deltaproteobacteria bacterium]